MFEWLLKYPLQRFREGEIGLATSLRVEFILLGLVLLGAGAWWMYRRETRLSGRWRRGALIALRALGVALLAVCILGPVLVLRKRQDRRGIIAVGLDVSRSMQLSGPGAGRSRFELARKALAGPGGLLEGLAGAGEVRLFAFGGATRPIRPSEVNGLSAGDEETRLAGAIKEMAQSLRGLPLHAVVLLTDGVDTSRADPAAMARYAASRGARVHAVGFGERASAPDAAILGVYAPRKVQRGAVADLRVVVRPPAPAAGPLELRLYQDVQLLKTQRIVPPAAGEVATVAMSFVPEGETRVRLTLEIPPVPGERIVENNRRDIQIEIADTRVDVLLVEGSPRHEYAFIRRAMRDSRQFRVLTLLRLGKGRYYERADDETFLTRGFPDTAERLGRFKAVVLSDIEAGFFTPGQLKLLSDFVKVRGGGLLMLGGVNSFNLGGYDETPIAGLLPVGLGPADTARQFEDKPFDFKVTKAGAEHEILRLTSDPRENVSHWALMPPLKGLNPLTRAKPGAEVLAVSPRSDPGRGQAVLLAVQNVGAGRAAAFAPANSWRWQMLQKSGNDTFRRFWSQMLRWLAVGAKEYLTVSTDSGVADLRQPVTLTAQVLDKVHRPFNEAKVAAKVKDPFGNVEELDLPWVLREDGVYQVLLRPSAKGEHVISVTADVAGVKLQADTSFLAVESSPEFARPTMDAAALERIAGQGRGTVDLAGRTDKAVEAILAAAKSRQRVLELVEERELRDAPILLLLIAGVWFLEWALRKRSGLA